MSLCILDESDPIVPTLTHSTFSMCLTRNKSGKSIDNQWIMITRRNFKLVTLSKIRLQTSLQFLKIASLRIGVVADDDTTVLSKSLKNVMMTILPRKIQIGIHSLYINPFHLNYLQYIISSTSANRYLLDRHIQFMIRLLWRSYTTLTAICNFLIPKCFFTRSITIDRVGYGSLKTTSLPIPSIGFSVEGEIGVQDHMSPRPLAIQSLTPPTAASQAVWGEYTAMSFLMHLIHWYYKIKGYCITIRGTRWVGSIFFIPLKMMGW